MHFGVYLHSEEKAEFFPQVGRTSLSSTSSILEVLEVLYVDPRLCCSAGLVKLSFGILAISLCLRNARSTNSLGQDAAISSQSEFF